MRLPHLRFTMRQLIIAVAVLALAACSVVMVRRHEAYRARAAFHAKQERIAGSRLRHWSQEAARLAGLPSDVSPPVPVQDRRFLEEMVDYSRNRVVYHRRLRGKYQRIARYPWLSIDPDPPSPDGVTPDAQ